jgi:L-lactate permease
MKKKYVVFFFLVIMMTLILLVGMMVGKQGGRLPDILSVLFGLLFLFLLLYSSDWLPKRKNKNHHTK